MTFPRSLSLSSSRSNVRLFRGFDQWREWGAGWLVALSGFFSLLAASLDGSQWTQVFILLLTWRNMMCVSKLCIARKQQHTFGAFRLIIIIIKGSILRILALPALLLMLLLFFNFILFCAIEFLLSHQITSFSHIHAHTYTVIKKKTRWLFPCDLAFIKTWHCGPTCGSNFIP